MVELGLRYVDPRYIGGSSGNVVEDIYVDMVNDAFRHDDHQGASYHNVEESIPVRNHSKKMYDLLEEANNPLYDGCCEGLTEKRI